MNLGFAARKKLRGNVERFYNLLTVAKDIYCQDQT